MRIAFLGPAGTFSAQAAAARATAADELLPQATIHAVVMAVHEGDADRGVVPVENSIEGSVNESLDAVIHDAPSIHVVGETVLPVSYCLIARGGVRLEDVEVVVSHPQSLGQCARFIRGTLPHAAVRAATSTAEAVRQVVSTPEPWGALGTRHAAGLYDGDVLAENVEDEDGNATRFLWLAAAPDGTDQARAAAWKSSVVFAGTGDGTPGWLARCLAEFADRAVNLTRIESRPARGRLGHYLFLIDLEGRADVAGAPRDAVRALAGHCTEVRLLGAYPAAA